MTVLKLPGMIDPHVHLRDLDWSHKATFQSETAAALAGGYWAVFDMPNTAPSTTTADHLQHKLDKIQQNALCDWGLYFGANQSGNWHEYSAVESQICGLKMFNNATTGDLLLPDQESREPHFAHWNTEKIIAVHAEGETVREILDLVRKYRRRTHFCHISTAEEIAYLKAAKAEGLPVSIGVTPHHLYLSENDLPALGSLGLMKPELKTRADCESLWNAVVSGLVDVIESDHAPHTLTEKASEKPPFGVPGLETTLPLMVLAVKENRISEDQLIPLLCTNAQNIWHIHPDPGTYTLVDLDYCYTIEHQNLRTAVQWSPFEGMTVYGKVLEVWSRGQQVYDGEQILAAPGFGCNLFGSS